MDFSTIKSKIDDGVYENLPQFNVENHYFFIGDIGVSFYRVKLKSCYFFYYRRTSF